MREALYRLDCLVSKLVEGGWENFLWFLFEGGWVPRTIFFLPQKYSPTEASSHIFYLPFHTFLLLNNIFILYHTVFSSHKWEPQITFQQKRHPPFSPTNEEKVYWLFSVFVLCWCSIMNYNDLSNEKKNTVEFMLCTLETKH